jgi:hypothetical protein
VVTPEVSRLSRNFCLLSPAADKAALHSPGARAAELRKEAQRAEQNGEPRAAATEPGAAEAGGAEGAAGVLPHPESTPRASALRRGAGGLAGGALPQRLVDAVTASSFMSVLLVLGLMAIVSFEVSDVINHLNTVRGKGMASMYSWSCKR